MPPRQEHASHLGKRFWTEILDFGVTLVNGLRSAMAIGPLARAGWGRVVGCEAGGVLTTANCLVNLGITLFDVWSSRYFGNSGISKRGITAEGYEVYDYTRWIVYFSHSHSTYAALQSLVYLRDA
jgi:hypothetical protein